MQYFKQLREIDGSLSVVEPSEQVQRILALSGLTDLLVVSAQRRSKQRPLEIVVEKSIPRESRMKSMMRPATRY